MELHTTDSVDSPPHAVIPPDGEENHPSEIAVYLFSVFNLKNMDDKNSVMDGQDEPVLGTNAERVYRMSRVRSVQFPDL